MAGFQIHIAIGKRYLENNKIKNETDFFKGIIAPDLTSDKKLTHYSGFQDKKDLRNYLANKVNLKEFLVNNEIDSDYQKGVFLHLLTDFLFFNYYFSKDYIKSVTYDIFRKDLYYSYEKNNKYVEEKYNLSDFPFWDIVNEDIRKAKKIVDINDGVRTNILENEKVDKFIEMVASFNLDNIKNKIFETDLKDIFENVNVG